MDELWSWNWVVFVVPVCWASLWSRVEVAIKCTTESHVSCDQSLLISKTMNSSQRLKLIQITSITQFIATEFRHTKERKRQPSHKFVFFFYMHYLHRFKKHLSLVSSWWQHKLQRWSCHRTPNVASISTFVCTHHWLYTMSLLKYEAKPSIKLSFHLFVI